MLEPIKNTSCQLGCWAISGAAAVLTFIMCFGLGKIAFMGAVFFSASVFVALGLLLGWVLCTPLTPLGSARAYPLVDASAVDSSLGNVFAEQSAATSGLAATQLPGEIELAARKSEWAYAPAETAADATAPGALAQPRNGQANDLKKIKGVGPKLETILNTLGVFHFDQIMAWGLNAWYAIPDLEEAELDARLLHRRAHGLEVPDVGVQEEHHVVAEDARQVGEVVDL